MAALTLVDAGPEPDFDAEYDRFWTILADAASEAIAVVHPDNPAAARLRKFAATVRRAAGVPAVRDIGGAS